MNRTRWPSAMMTFFGDTPALVMVMVVDSTGGEGEALSPQERSPAVRPRTKAERTTFRVAIDCYRIEVGQDSPASSSRCLAR